MSKKETIELSEVLQELLHQQGISIYKIVFLALMQEMIRKKIKRKYIQSLSSSFNSIIRYEPIFYQGFVFDLFVKAFYHYHKDKDA